MGSSCTRRIELFHGVVAQMFCKSSEHGAEMTRYRGEDIHKICDGGELSEPGLIRCRDNGMWVV